MSQVIAQPFDCNQVCVPSGTSSTPGIQGVPGTNGTNGTNGINALTLSTTGTDVMPAEGGSVTVTTSSSTAFLAVGEVAFVQFWGYMEVTAKPTSTSVTLLNLENTASSAYTGNAAPGTVLPAGAYIVPGGVQGPAGSNPATALLSGNNLNDVGSPSTSRNNLGLGTAAVKTAANTNGSVPLVDDGAGLTNGEALFATATGIESKTAANSRTALGLGTMATQGSGAVTITGGTITGITDLAVADGGTGASTPAAARNNLGVLSGYGLLAEKLAVDLNTAGDNTLTVGAATYIIDKMTVNNASINLTLATAGVFTAVGGGGTTLAADGPLSALTASSKYLDLTPQAVVGTDTRTEATLYLRVGTPQGAAATADFRLYGWKL